jgi:hypothetical protein
MTDDLLRRLRAANPVPDPDRLVWFGEPDPPSHPELRAVLERARSTDGRSARTPTEKRSTAEREEPPMRTISPTRTDGDRSSDERGPGRGRVIAVAAGLVGLLAAAGALTLTGTGPLGGFAVAPDPVDRAAEAVEVAEAYLAAHDAHDAEAARSLLADDVVITMATLLEVEELAPAFEAHRILEYRVSPFDCAVPTSRDDAAADGPIRVDCDYTLTTRLQRIVDHPPIEATFRFGLEEGAITWISDGFPYEEFSPNVWEPFADWLDRRDSVSYGVLYRSEGGVEYPRLTPQALELLPVVLDEYEQWVGAQED